MFGQRFISEQLKSMNSTNWPAPNVWVFIAQLVEHCSANAEVMDSNPVEAPKTFFGLNCPKNVFGASTGFESMTSALALQCSTN